MDAMYSAIKSRRGGLLNDQEENAHQEPMEAKPGGMDMAGLVDALSPEQKSELLALLVGGEQAPAPAKAAPAIEKGAMGPGEEAELSESLGDGQESEGEIADSLLSSADSMRAVRGDKPRNLGERMKFDLAKKKQKKGE